MSFSYATDPTIVSGDAIQNTSISAPTSLFVGQANKIIAASVEIPSLVQVSPVAGMRLYRMPIDGDWELVDDRTLDTNSRWQNLFDLKPLYALSTSYTATAYSVDGTESPKSNIVQYVAIANPLPLTPARGISAAAFGPNPLLGSDIFIDPNTGEAVIGPNGDLLTVNGLELLEQDLRTRLLTNPGELVLHPTYGFIGASLIGSGQSDPVSMSQLLRTRVIDCLMAEPRVLSIDQVVITRPQFDNWQISYVVYAIGVEDPLQANLVFPYSSS